MSTGLWRLFRRGGDEGEGEGKATHAHLGEENQFYYNKELKRWLIRGEEHLAQQQDTPPPPPAAVATVGRQQPDNASPPVGGIRRMRTRGAASLYTATPGLSTKSSGSKESAKRPLTFVMPPYRMPRQLDDSQQQHVERTEQGPLPVDNRVHEAAADTSAHEGAVATGSECKEGCRVRAASSEPPFSEGPGWTATQVQQQQHQVRQQQQPVPQGEPSTEKIEPIKRANASAQCSTGAPSPPEGEASALSFSVGQQQREEVQQLSFQVNGVEQTVDERQPGSEATFASVQRSRKQELSQEQELLHEQEQEGLLPAVGKEGNGVAALMLQDQERESAEGPCGRPSSGQHPLLQESDASAAVLREPCMQPVDAAPATVAQQTAEAAAEFKYDEASGRAIEDSLASEVVAAFPLQKLNGKGELLTPEVGVVAPWREQPEEQPVELQQQQPEQQCIDQQLHHEALALPAPGGSSSSCCSTGASPKSEVHPRNEADGRASMLSRNSQRPSPHGATATSVAGVATTADPGATVPVPTDAGEEQIHRSASLQTDEASERSNSHPPPSEIWGPSVSPAASLQQEERLLLEQHEVQQHCHLPQHAEQQRHQAQQLNQGLFMEDILPGFARAVQDLEKSSAETLRQLAALQQQVGVLRSRNACLTARIQQVTEQLLSGEGPLVERQRAAELLQEALGAATAEFPSPIGDDSEPQPSPTCSAVSDAEAALEEAQGAVSALTHMLVEQMERNRQLQEEDMHFDADVVQFITQLQQQHGSLEPFLQQQLLLQEAHMEQQESLTNLKRMHDDLSRRMEESCARAADLEGQLASALEKRQHTLQELDNTQQELHRSKALLQQAQQQHELRAKELLYQSQVREEELVASKEQLGNLHKETEQQKALLADLQEKLAVMSEREAAATTAKAAAEAAQEAAESEVARRVLANEQLQQELQHQQQEQRKQVEVALKERQDALERVSSMQQQQREMALEHRQREEGLERQLLAREFMVEQLQREVNEKVVSHRQEQEQHKAELEQLRQQHSVELQKLAEEHAVLLKQQEEQNQKQMEEKQRIRAACHDEVERAQQQVDALQQQLAQQEEQHELMTQRQQEDSEQFHRRLEQQERAASEQLQQLQRQAEETRLLLEQKEVQWELTLRKKVEEVEAAAELRVESLKKELRDATSALEAERTTLEQQVEQHEALRKQHESLQQGYDNGQQQAARERSELEERIATLEAQLQTQQELLQAAREELLQQPILLQQKHEEDLKQQLAALQQVELEERGRLQEERDQLLQQQQEEHALLMQQLREQHALEQQQLQKRMQQEQQEQQEVLRSHFEQLWNEESAKMVAANAAVVDQLNQAQQLLLKEQQQLEEYENQRDALEREREEVAVMKTQLLAANADVQKLEQRCEALERQRDEVLQQRSTPEAEVQAAMEEEISHLRRDVLAKERLARQLQQQLDEHVASQRDRLGEVNAMLERQEEASKQKDLRLRSVEEELQALQQLLQDTVDVKQLEAARAEVAEGNRRVQKLEADLAAAIAEQESLKEALHMAEEKLKNVCLRTETGTATETLSRHPEMREASIQAVGDDASGVGSLILENLERQAKRAHQKNEELAVRNATLTRISDFLSRRLQFFERALADMGPHGLVVIEDCDRSVVLAPPEIESSLSDPPVPELLIRDEEHGDSLAAPTTKETAGAPLPAPRCSGDEAMTVSGVPPSPPEFLRAFKSTPKT